MDDLPVHKASELISRIIQPQNAEDAKGWTDFYASWSSIAGDFYSAHARPVDVRNGTVLVEADHPGWIQRMQFDQARLLKAIQRRFPSLKIRSIAFRTAADTSLPGTVVRRSAKQAGKNNSEAEKAELPGQQESEERAGSIAEVIDKVEDAGFRTILSSLAETLKKSGK
ncbi:MAG: DUF721 domain-containing protein [Spirochaetes bacterium]|nr:DUF721 domain-containing protein [Spirochaetota bacterium]MBU0954569.1 DUF721 domain-containing protein [Spirochaetota bacterium]